LSGSTHHTRGDADPTDTAVLERIAPGLAWLPRALRDRFTPAALGSAVTALAIAIVYVVNAQHNIMRLNETVAGQQKQLDLLQGIETQIAVMSGKVDSIVSEVDRQRAWRERIEDAAESGPHGKRR
jgi:hypothetical protein